MFFGLDAVLIKFCDKQNFTLKVFCKNFANYKMQIECTVEIGFFQSTKKIVKQYFSLCGILCSKHL